MTIFFKLVYKLDQRGLLNVLQQIVSNHQLLCIKKNDKYFIITQLKIIDTLYNITTPARRGFGSESMIMVYAQPITRSYIFNMEHSEC